MQDSSLYHYFLGTWILRRKITNHLINTFGAMDGKAIFMPIDIKTLYYKETGDLLLESYQNNFSQEYLYKNLEHQKGQVFFIDNRPFYDLDMERGIQHVQHRCGQDLYKGTVQLATPHEWYMTWHITGPKKHMIIFSEYYAVQRF